ncbi:hypothetical protein C3486_13675 [Streptomyces sp. Ru73]|uniref:hypothetical protein n=1 Tax=Streptomyces sp. Ru73 TaxID=2080748 RepID=UPI000CDD82DF|nr:hypothetical protein [Streptomyces sp. Ru73]POX40391.1 hypothetical protein C3486_13675 [Streptomyces sp. Ru73]
MDLEALQHGNFARLGEAVTDWSDMVGKLTRLRERAERELDGKAKKADWAGLNATVTREFVTKTAAEFADAVTQASSIRNILRDTRGELISHREKLRDALGRARDKKISVVPTGGGKFVVSSLCTAEEEQPTEGELGAVRDEIAEILGKATECDTTAAKVLRTLVDQSKYGFSGASYKDRDSAARAVHRAEEWARAARNPKGMSLKQLGALGRDLKKYRNDELFAETFATKLGGNGTLEFWTRTAGAHQGDRGHAAMLRDLQTNLGMTLATATHSDSPAMQHWEESVVTAGNTSFRPDPVRSSAGALGFQVMSSLLRHGRYDTEFLDSYGSALLRKDKSHAMGATRTEEIWENIDGVDLVFGKDDGHDPVTGFMTALSHAPEAAEHTFARKADLNHLLESTKNTDRGTSVGQALEAAVTGVAHGDTTPAAPVPHNRTQVAIMRNVMHAVANPDGGSALVDNHMGASLGHMAAAYMPEINRTIAGLGAEHIFLTNSDAPDGLDRADTYRFLSALGRDDDASAAVVYGRSIYTSSTMEAHIADPHLFGGSTSAAIEAISHNSGLIDGILAHSRQGMEVEHQQEGEQGENEAMQRQGEFFKTMLSTGFAVGAVALAPVGATAEAAVGAGGAFFSAAATMGVDRIMDGRELDGLDKAMYQSGRRLYISEDDTLGTVIEAGRQARKSYDSGPSQDAMDNEIREAVRAGWLESDTRLEEVGKSATS